MAGKTELGRARKPRKPKTPKKKQKAEKSALRNPSRMYAVASGRTSAGAGRTISDQDVASIAAAISRLYAAQSGRTSYKYIGEEAKHRATGPGRKKGGRAKK